MNQLLISDCIPHELYMEANSSATSQIFIRPACEYLFLYKLANCRLTPKLMHRKIFFEQTLINTIILIKISCVKLCSKIME